MAPVDEDAPLVPGARRWDKPIRIRRGMRRQTLCLPHMPGARTIHAHANTVGNCARTVRERVLGSIRDGVWVPTLQPTRRAWSHPTLAAIRRRVLRRVNQRALPFDREAFAGLYRGPKRKTYLRAARKLDMCGIARKDANIRAFLKAEKWSKDAAGRLISPASSEYICELGRYLLPIEHNMYRAWELAVGYPIIMKGRTQEQRAEVMASHWGSFKEPVAVGLDASKFDQHTSVDA